MTALPLDREALRVACSKVIARYSETCSARASDGPNEDRDDDAVAVARAALDLEARVAELERAREADSTSYYALFDSLAAAEANVREAREALDECRARLEVKLGTEGDPSERLENLMRAAEAAGSKPWRAPRHFSSGRS